MRTAPTPSSAEEGAHLLEALLEAARDGDEGTVRSILARIERVGTPLARERGDGPRRPSPSVLAELRRTAARSATPWLLPCAVKSLPTDPTARAALSVVARELRARRPENHVETHLVGGVAVSQYVDSHVDLRSVLVARGPDDRSAVRAVHELCIERLLDYADQVDVHIQAALREVGFEPARFDYEGRLRRATATLERAVRQPGTNRVDGWGEIADLCARPGGRWALFYDPKPANFLTHEASLRDGRPREPVYKVDIDWMLTLGPVSHQALVAVLSHPILPSESGGPDAVLANLCKVVQSAMLPADSDAEQLDALAVYHLYRNYAAKLGSAPAQARALKPFLTAALDRLTGVAPPEGTRELIEASDRLSAAA